MQPSTWRGRGFGGIVALGLLASACGFRTVEPLEVPETARFEVPIEVRRGVVLVKVRIDGLARELTMMLDTGAPTVVSHLVAQELGLVSGSDVAVVDASGNELGAVAITLPGVSIGGMNVARVSAFSMKLPEFENLCAPIDGVIGVGREESSGFLDRTAVEIDYAGQRLVLAKSGEALTPGGAKVKIRRRDVLPDGSGHVVTATRAEVEIEGVRQWVTLDTGNSGPVDLAPNVFLGLGRSFEETGLVTRRGALSQSAGGVQLGTSYETRLQSLRLGDVELRGVPITVERPDGDAPALMAPLQVLLGYALLRNFKLVLDVRAGLARFIPVPGANPSDSLAGPGFAWREVDGKIVAATLVSGGPAERAGIALFDEIVAIDGVALKAGDREGQCAARASIDALGDRELPVRVRRDGVERDVNLRIEPVLPPYTGATP